MGENLPILSIPPFVIKNVSTAQLRTETKALLAPVTRSEAGLRWTFHGKIQAIIVPPLGGTTMLRAYEIGEVTPAAVNFVMLSMLRDREQGTPEKPLPETFEEIVRRFDLYNGAIERGFDLYNGAIERGFTPPIGNSK